MQMHPFPPKITVKFTTTPTTGTLLTEIPGFNVVGPRSDESATINHPISAALLIPVSYTHLTLPTTSRV